MITTEYVISTVPFTPILLKVITQNQMITNLFFIFFLIYNLFYHLLFLCYVHLHQSLYSTVFIFL